MKIPYDPSPVGFQPPRGGHPEHKFAPDEASPFSRSHAPPVPYMRMMQSPYLQGGVNRSGRDEPLHASQARFMEDRLAKKTCAACFQALHEIQGGTAGDSPALDYSGGRPVKLRQPRDLHDSFQKFLNHPGLGTDEFSSRRSPPMPGVTGVRAAGDSIIYSMKEIPHAEPGGRRQIVITIDSAQPPATGLVHGLRASLHRMSETAKTALGANTKMDRFGEALGDWVSQLLASDPRITVTIQAADLGTTAAVSAFNGSLSRGQPVKLNLFNPVPLVPPADPSAFAQSVEKLGGMQEVRKLVATFRQPGAVLDPFEHLPGARALLKLSDANWDPREFSTVYDYRGAPDGRRYPTAHDIAQAFKQPMMGPGYGQRPIQDVYLSQQRKANRLLL